MGVLRSWREWEDCHVFYLIDGNKDLKAWLQVGKPYKTCDLLFEGNRATDTLRFLHGVETLATAGCGRSVNPWKRGGKHNHRL